MNPLNPKLVLDPLWITQANYVDLEYYTYILMDAKQKYLTNLDEGFFNFYEIVFHYLNLNTIIADKRLYDSKFNSVKMDSNLVKIVSELSDKEDSPGKAIVKMASSIFSEVLLKYLEKQIQVLESLNFHFNNTNFYKLDKIYIVCKSNKLDKYEVFKLNTNTNRSFKHSITRKAVLYLPGLKQNEFRDKLLESKPLLEDFQPEKNVIVISGTDNSSIQNAICLVKDLILLNRIMNLSHGFDANVLLDYNRLLEKKKTIPYKLKY